jgi:TetR/AcrR family transcriptional regulator, repressor for neighboring sulfatase
MGAPRGDSRVTRKAILAAARELFAKHGVDGVSVRQIAAAAGINHALVHRYFGTKDEMVAEIILAEARALSAMATPEADTLTSLASLREGLAYLLGERRTSLLLMLRAELDGLAPEQMLAEAPLRPLRLLATWVEQNSDRGPAAAHADPRLVAMVLGAAVFGLASMQPMLAAGVGLLDEDPDEVLRGCVQTVLGLAAASIGADPPSASGGDGEA